jgi:hypothetical protein
VKLSKELQDDKRVQFYNPAKFDPEGPVVEQDIPWSAFPKEILRQYGYERALREADMLWPLTRYTGRNTGTILERTWYRPLNEYCEWHVARDLDTNKIKKVPYPPGTKYQPEEHVLQLLPEHFAELRAALESLGNVPTRKILNDFIIEPLV